MSETIDIPVRIVVVKDRIRKDLGDTTSLMVSMEKNGQLQPIGIDLQNNLIFGERRLDAATRAGWETIRATRFSDKEDAARAMAAEFDENSERKEFTTLEVRAAAKKLEAYLKPAGVAKREQNLKRGEVTAEIAVPEVPNLGTSGKPRENPPKSPAKTREIVAAALGKSPETIRKIDVVATAAEQPDALPEVKAAAEEMERTGRVDPAFKAVQAATKPPEPEPRFGPEEMAALERANTLATLKIVGQSVRRIPNIDHAGALRHLEFASFIIEGGRDPAPPPERTGLDPVAEMALPAELDTPAFRDKWREWCRYRRKRKPAVSADAARKTFAKLSKVPIATALQAIDDAISNDWRGIFPERMKGRAHHAGPGQAYQPSADSSETAGRL